MQPRLAGPSQKFTKRQSMNTSPLQNPSPYHQANTDWLAACDFGLSVHWTARTVPRAGRQLSFQDAVDQFDLDRFLQAVDTSGAAYVIFTATHALQMLPCPHPVVDKILLGRTTTRDLLGEIARALAARGKPLIVYYNHSCNVGDDPAWEQAVGYHDETNDRFIENLCDVVRWLGESYGDLIKAWWFDSSYSIDPRGPNNTVTGNFKSFPWEELTRAAKAGLPERLIAYNAGIGDQFLYTTHQDFWAGEMVNLATPPTGRYLSNGLQWHGWTCLDDARWVYEDPSTAPHPPLYSDRELLDFLSLCRRHRAPMCFNLLAFQDGSVFEESVAQLARIRHALSSHL
jgi:hypothetical protein